MGFLLLAISLYHRRLTALAQDTLVPVEKSAPRTDREHHRTCRR